MIAIHGLDNSVEYLLRILVKHLDMETVSGKNFDTVELAGLAGEVNAFLREHYSIRLPYQADIRILRQVRNLVQHGAVDPRAELTRFEKIVTRFYQYIFKNIFGLELDALRLSSLVRDPTVQEFLKNAERRLDSKQYLEAIIASRDAFENAYYEKIKNSNVRLFGLPAILDAQNFSPQTSYFFQSVIDELEQSKLGLDSARLERFHDYVRHIPSEHKVEAWGPVMMRAWEKNDADFCYHFAADAIMRWQSQAYDSLTSTFNNDPSPFTFKRWLSNVNLSGTAVGCMYIEGDGIWAESFWADTDIKNELMAIEVDSVCEVRTSRYQNGEFEWENKYKNILLAHHARLIVNNPPRWSVMLRFSRLDDDASNENID